MVGNPCVADCPLLAKRIREDEHTHEGDERAHRYNEKQGTMQLRPAPGNGTAPPRFRVGDLEVDIGRAEVTRGDEKIALPKLSFDLLCALINAAPAIVTNDDLLQQVWPGLQVSPESVAQRVKLLRSAIGDDSQQPRYILGVRGRGYRLIPSVERCEPGLPISHAAHSPGDTSSATLPDRPIQTVTRSEERRVGKECW